MYTHYETLKGYKCEQARLAHRVYLAERRPIVEVALPARLQQALDVGRPLVLQHRPLTPLLARDPPTTPTQKRHGQKRENMKQAREGSTDEGRIKAHHDTNTQLA